ncbi:hypothetical protein L1049_008302 [Liquidambar formosana]|uniref:Uncharacterized protein n=1 Tax=Liquidambar formosana TaxID=63359 RepID=A0AAP0S2T9_LIQFO
MPKFDPWPVFFRREWSRNWPFLVGFAVTGTLITKLTSGLTGEFRNAQHRMECSSSFLMGGKTGKVNLFLVFYWRIITFKDFC